MSKQESAVSSDIETKGILVIICSINKKDAEQNECMCRLICAFVVRVWDETCFLVAYPVLIILRY